MYVEDATCGKHKEYDDRACFVAAEDAVFQIEDSSGKLSNEELEKLLQWLINRFRLVYGT